MALGREWPQNTRSHCGGELMSAHKNWQPEKVRAELSHPVIDGDGHWIEYGPVFAEQVRKAAGDKAADGLLRHMRRIPDALSLSVAERRRRGIAMEGYWGRQSTNTRDRATAMMPRMLYDRLDELGIDFGVIYPTAGLGIARIEDDETRRAVVRGFHIAAAGHAVAKALFLGGVTRRFPDVHFGFLEGGVGWGCQLFADLIEHWERRGKAGL